MYAGLAARRGSSVGAGLLAKAVGQLMKVLAVPPSSRASPLPQGIGDVCGTCGPPRIQCGSGLARESGGSADGGVGCATVFASRLSLRELGMYAGLAARRGSSVGASLLAKAVGQLMQILAVPPSSRASSLPQGIGDVCRICEQSKSNVGAGLLAKAVGQLMKVLAVPPSSRAGSLPQGIGDVCGTCGPPRIQCGSEPARESGGSVDADIGCAAVFASKPAPTGNRGCMRDLRPAEDPVWERACSRKRWVS